MMHIPNDWLMECIQINDENYISHRIKQQPDKNW
jgi:hypothetical protein